MGDRLRIDLGVVGDTATRLGSIGTSLEGAESAADELAGMIPHRGLAGCVEKFVGVVGTGVSWHDDVINGGIMHVTPGMRDLVRGAPGDALGHYGDWWSEVDGGTVEVVGEWDPAGKS